MTSRMFRSWLVGTVLLVVALGAWQFVAAQVKTHEMSGTMPSLLTDVPGGDRVAFLAFTPDSSKAAVITRSAAGAAHCYVLVRAVGTASAWRQIPILPSVSPRKPLEVEWLPTDMLWIRNAPELQPSAGKTEIYDFSEARAYAVQSFGWNKPLSVVAFYNHNKIDELLASGAASSASGSAIASIMADERRTLAELKKESDIVIKDSSLTFEQKRTKLAAAEYNRRVDAVISESLSKIRSVLAPEEYLRFVAWVNRQWVMSYVQHALKLKCGMIQSDNHLSTAASSCTVWATQYEGDTNNEVAVPDKCLKFANRQWQHCPGYSGSQYRVDIVRGGYSVSNVIVWEVGPWNEDDNYTNTPVGRRMFTDLDDCTPEAEAAYYNDYNNGLDQFGREVLNPAGIDLVPGIASMLGLGQYENDWVDVTYHFSGTPSGPVDPSKCSVSCASSSALSVFVVPNGSGRALSSSYTYGGSTANGTITLTARDSNNQTVSGVPAEDMWLESTSSHLCFCPEGTIADGSTDASGCAVFTHALRAGGKPASGETLLVVIQGQHLTGPQVALHFNSPDLNGDLRVNLTDTVQFTALYGLGYNYAIDYYWDGYINLSDVTLYAAAIGGAC